MDPLTENSKMPPLAESVSSKLTPTVRNRIFIAIHTLQSNGVKAAVSHYSERIVDKVIGKQGRPVDKPNICEERFSARASDHSVDQLAIQSDNAKWGLLYEPSRAEVLHTALRKISERLDNYTFIDLGAGKGLPLLLASEYPFKSIIGVEYSEILADAADLNIQTHKSMNPSAAPIRCVRGDATEFVFPQEPTVLYLFNPFQGKVMDRVIANLETSLREHPRDLWVIYVNPWEMRKFRRHPLFETIEWNLDYSIHRFTHR
jgi:hypothetical protein